MAFYLVRWPNKVAKVGTILDRTDDGYEKVILNETKEGLMSPGGYTGLIIPHVMLDPFTIKLPKKGGMADARAFGCEHTYFSPVD